MTCNKKTSHLTRLPVDSSIFHWSQKENRLFFKKHSYLMYHCFSDLEARQQTNSLQKSLKAGNKNVFWNSILIFISFLRACGIFPGCNSACLVKETFSLCVQIECLSFQPLGSQWLCALGAPHASSLSMLCSSISYQPFNPVTLGPS